MQPTNREPTKKPTLMRQLSFGRRTTRDKSARSNGAITPAANTSASALPSSTIRRSLSFQRPKKSSIETAPSTAPSNGASSLATRTVRKALSFQRPKKSTIETAPSSTIPKVQQLINQLQYSPGITCLKDLFDQINSTSENDITRFTNVR